jgi:hypothetical protein
MILATHGIIQGRAAAPSASIVTDGLNFYIAPNIVAPSGTTVYDYLGNNVGTINNATGVFQTTNGGQFQLDGGNQSITITKTLPFTTTGCTVQIMFQRSNAANPTATPPQGAGFKDWCTLFSSRVFPNTFIVFDSINGTQNFAIEGQSVSSTTTLASNNTDWCLITATLNPTSSTAGTYTIYKNDISTGYSLNGNVYYNFGTFSFNFRIGEDNGNGRFFKGNVGNFLFYNKVLSSSEITQNFNALKTRFGL